MHVRAQSGENKSQRLRTPRARFQRWVRPRQKKETRAGPVRTKPRALRGSMRGARETPQAPAGGGERGGGEQGIPGSAHLAGRSAHLAAPGPTAQRGTGGLPCWERPSLRSSRRRPGTHLPSPPRRRLSVKHALSSAAPGRGARQNSPRLPHLGRPIGRGRRHVGGWARGGASRGRDRRSDSNAARRKWPGTWRGGAAARLPDPGPVPPCRSPGRCFAGAGPTLSRRKMSRIRRRFGAFGAGLPPT